MRSGVPGGQLPVPGGGGVGGKVVGGADLYGEWGGSGMGQYGGGGQSSGAGDLHYNKGRRSFKFKCSYRARLAGI